ncbi:hypothetical protein HJFPF1_00725 [Paramyrothecium foliicola]|nr:hypothetical protein HJFPF1_00725 [Paramyrothecium foliicola]
MGLDFFKANPCSSSTVHCPVSGRTLTLTLTLTPNLMIELVFPLPRQGPATGNSAGEKTLGLHFSAPPADLIFHATLPLLHARLGSQVDDDALHA